MADPQVRVVIVTGASRGIGAGIVAEYRRLGWAVVANSLTIKPSEDRDVLTVAGDIAEPSTTDRIIDEALDRFGRIDTLVNNAGLFISKPFTAYTAGRLRVCGRRQPDRILPNSRSASSWRC